MNLEVTKSPYLSNTGKEKYNFKCIECGWNSRDSFGSTNVNIGRIMQLSKLEPTQDNVRSVIGDMCNGNLRNHVSKSKDRSSIYKQFCCCNEQSRKEQKEREMLFEPVQKHLDNLSWLREYLFHLSKDQELNTNQISIYNQIENHIERSYYTLRNKGNRNDIIQRANKLKRLLDSSMNKLNINSNDLIEFISNKQTGFFAKELLKQAQNES